MNLLLVISALGIGLMFVLPIAKLLFWYEKIAASIFFGYTIGSIFLIILIKYLGYDLGQLIFSLIGIGLYSLILIFKYFYYKKHAISIRYQNLVKKTKSYFRRPKKTNKFYKVAHHLFTLIFILFWSSLFLYLAWTHSLLPKRGGYYTAGGAYGDMALHATFVNYFAQQTKLNLRSPIYAIEDTSYPFMVNFLPGLWVRNNMSLHNSLFFSSSIFLVCIIIFVYSLGQRLSKSHLVTSVFSLFFFFNGGLGFYYFFIDWMNSKKTLVNFANNMQYSYTHLAEKNLRWSNMIADYFLPQRGFLVGMSSFLLFLLIINLIWNFQDHKYKFLNLDIQKILIFISSVIVIIMPFFHVHAALTIFSLFTWIAVIKIVQDKKNLVFWALSLVFNTIIIFVQIFYQSEGLSSSFVSFKYGWMKDSEEYLIYFWLKNMGIEFIFLTLGSIYFFMNKNFSNFIKVLLFPMLMLFLLTNLFSFQPHIYDNMKFMLFTHVLISLISALILFEIAGKFCGKYILIIVTTILLTISGIITIYREMRISWLISDRHAIRISEEIKKQTKRDGIFLTSDAHNHPAVMLGGRPTVLGFGGWLWTHGIDYEETKKDVMKIFTGDEEAFSLIKKYKVDYVYIGVLENSQYQANEDFFIQNFPIIIETEQAKIFDVQKLPLF